MTLVDTTTGEVVDIADQAEAVAICAEITAHVAHVNAHLGQLADHIAEGMRRRVWIGMGYGSWSELVDAQGWVFRANTIPERVAMVEMLRTNGMSLRAIGKLIGASHQTVIRDLAGGPDGPPDEVEPTEPTTIVGQDGKQYPAARPTLAPSTDADPTPSGDNADVDGATHLRAPADTVPSITEPTAIAAPGAPAGAGDTAAAAVEETLVAVMAGTPEEQARSNHLRRWYTQAAAWGPHSPEALADAAPYAATDLDEDVARFEQRVVDFASAYRQARRSGLRVLEGGRR